MSLQDLAQNYPINGSVKEVNDTDLLRRIIKKIEDYKFNNDVRENQIKESRTNHFDIGGAKELSNNLIQQYKIPSLTSSTSVHSPLKGINAESRKRIMEIKERLRQPSGVDKALKPISENKRVLVGKIKKRFRKQKDIRPKSVEQNDVKIMNEQTKRRIEALYGVLKKTSIQATYDKNKEDKIETEDPLKLIPKFVRKGKKNKSK